MNKKQLRQELELTEGEIYALLREGEWGMDYVKCGERAILNKLFKREDVYFKVVHKSYIDGQVHETQKYVSLYDLEEE